MAERARQQIAHTENSATGFTASPTELGIKRLLAAKHSPELLLRELAIIWYEDFGLSEIVIFTQTQKVVYFVGCDEQAHRRHPGFNRIFHETS